MTTIGQALSTAIAHHQAGRLPQAEKLYREVLRADPRQPDAIHLLGVIAHQVGQHERAIEYIGRSIALAPQPACYNNLGEALRALGRYDEAIANYQTAIRLAPGYADPLSNLAAALLELGKPTPAAEACRRALAIKPDYIEAHNNLGNALKELGQHGEADRHYRRALAINPQYYRAYNNLGVSLQEQGEAEAAIVEFERALAIFPDYAEAENSLANALKDLGRYDEAERRYRRALELEPQRPEFHLNLSLLLLLTGRFEQGWAEYEWRRRTKLFRPRNYEQPYWDGGDLAGRTILLYAEQGFGDTLQFIRYAPRVCARGGRVIVQVQRELIPLLHSAAGVDRFVAKDDPLPEFDTYASLLSLPGIFGDTEATLPAVAPYLAADAERVAQWRTRLADLPRPLVGLHWQGNPRFKADHSRSFPLALLEPLGRVAGVSLVSMQHGAGREQLAAWPGPPLADLGGEFDAGRGAFVDSAAILSQLDLLITSDTAIAHLAGALGRPTWVLTPFSPDWRWLLARSDSPWYPTLRLFRPSAPRDWPPVVSAVADELARWRAAYQPL